VIIGVGGILMVFDLQNNCDSLNFKTMDDEVIVELAKSDNPGALEYIISKYKSFVRTKARAYFLVGADNDDIVQEGMIGLYKAIRDYDKHKLTSFRSFAEICITRQIITAIKSATRQKHIPLNFYVSLNKPVYEEESERTLEDIISGNKATDPMELFIGREDMDIMESKIGEVLSELEMEVLMSYIDGKTYQEIAEDLNRDVKSVDNALQRVKRKLERFLSSK
jgi:RNA polymerase sporulation-specific sigma factor